MDVKKIGVIGAGQMGHGIALVAAKANFDVILRDIKDEFVQKGLSKIERFLDKSIEKGKMSADEKKKILSHLKGTTKLEDLKDSDLIIEAIFENIKVKKVILVAANNPAVSEKNQAKDTHGFYELGNYNFEKIKKHCESFVVLHSEDDEWVPFLAGEENAKGLDAKFLKYKDRGHFGSKLPKPEIPELLDEIL